MEEWKPLGRLGSLLDGGPPVFGPVKFLELGLQHQSAQQGEASHADQQPERGLLRSPAVIEAFGQEVGNCNARAPIL